jgi:hypothetical protein
MSTPMAAMVKNPEPQTGVSIPMWFDQTVADQLTGESAPSGVLYCNSLHEYSHGAEFHAQVWDFALTDAGASQRTRQVGVVDWSRNLAGLTAVAEAVIPGLREPSPAERKNLRQYYRKLFRKA